MGYVHLCPWHLLFISDHLLWHFVQLYDGHQHCHLSVWLVSTSHTNCQSCQHCNFDDMPHGPSSETSMLYSSCHHSTNAPTTWSIPLLVSRKYKSPVTPNVASRMQVFENGTDWAMISTSNLLFAFHTSLHAWPKSFAMTISGILEAYWVGTYKICWVIQCCRWRRSWFGEIEVSLLSCSHTSTHGLYSVLNAFLAHQLGNHQRQQSRQSQNAIVTQNTSSATTVWMTISSRLFWCQTSTTGPFLTTPPLIVSWNPSRPGSTIKLKSGIADWRLENCHHGLQWRSAFWVSHLSHQSNLDETTLYRFLASISTRTNT